MLSEKDIGKRIADRHGRHGILRGVDGDAARWPLRIELDPETVYGSLDEWGEVDGAAPSEPAEVAEYRALAAEAKPWNACSCGEVFDPPHLDGLFWDGDEIHCGACGRRWAAQIQPDQPCRLSAIGPERTAEEERADAVAYFEQGAVLDTSFPADRSSVLQGAARALLDGRHVGAAKRARGLSVSSRGKLVRIADDAELERRCELNRGAGPDPDARHDDHERGGR